MGLRLSPMDALRFDATALVAHDLAGSRTVRDLTRGTKHAEIASVDLLAARVVEG